MREVAANAVEGKLSKEATFITMRNAQPMKILPCTVPVTETPGQPKVIFSLRRIIWVAGDRIMAPAIFCHY